jgi:hypothetical protein
MKDMTDEEIEASKGIVLQMLKDGADAFFNKMEARRKK